MCVRASNRFRVTFETNCYSVPEEYASQRLTLKANPDQICLYTAGQRIARHSRSYDRHGDFEDPNHPKALLAERRKMERRKSLSTVCLKWPEIFNNDSTLTSAVLDRLLHHAETVKIEGRSFRMKNKIDST